MTEKKEGILLELEIRRNLMKFGYEYVHAEAKDRPKIVDQYMEILRPQRKALDEDNLYNFLNGWDLIKNGGLRPMVKAICSKFAVPKAPKIKYPKNPYSSFIGSPLYKTYEECKRDFKKLNSEE